MKKLNMALGTVIFGLMLGEQLFLRYCFGLEVNLELGVLVGIIIGLSATVGYVYSKLEEVHEEKK